MSDVPTTTYQQHQPKKRQRGQELSILIQVSMPIPEVDKCTAVADKEGITRSELIRRALQIYYHAKLSKASD